MERAAETFGCIVVGAGASGLMAALAATDAGLKVLVVEKDSVVGGSSALSGGWIWAPLNRFARAEGIEDSRDAALTYIRTGAGSHFLQDRVDAYLDQVNPALDFLERTGWFRFFMGGIPDYRHPEDGAVLKGRSLCCEPFSTLKMKGCEKTLREPLRALKVMGIPIASGPELWHFLNASRSVRSALFIARVIGCDLWDKLRYGRSTRLVNGNSLMARLVMACDAAGIEIRLSTPVAALTADDAGRIDGVTLEGGGTIAARRGVILAAGGFPWDLERRKRVFAHHPGSADHLTMAPACNTGDGLSMAEHRGAAVIEDYATPAAWFPVSEVPRRNAPSDRFIHFVDRGKPGVIAVTPQGHRFVDEGTSYGGFVEAMIDTAEGDTPRSAWLICDRDTLQRYGLGAARPWPVPHGDHLASGYLKRGRTLADLAAKIGVPATTLESTVARFNAQAEAGCDTDHHRAEGAISRYNGDLSRPGNPGLAPLKRGPFYAVETRPGDIGTFAGLATDAHARVLDTSGEVLAGLYAVGNDQASVFGGAYPGAGATLGPALTFGFIAGQHIANRNTANEERILT